MDGWASRGGSSADIYVSHYKLERTLGIGSFGKVKIAEHIPTGHKVAIKIFERHEIKIKDGHEKVRREINIMRMCMHPHIIRLYEVIETQTSIYMVMEYCESGELFDHITQKGKLQDDEARLFFQQIISGLDYCHSNMVVHRDLKPENLLLDSEKCNVKIIDFGLSNIMRKGHLLKTSCGSPNYAAPELICGNLYAGPEVDVWSCGVILYAFLCGKLPFENENLSILFRKIKAGSYTLPSYLSTGARDLISRMIVVDPMKRITIPEIRQHPWFQIDLPCYLAVPPPNLMQQAKKIDERIVQEVIRMGFDRNDLIKCLCNRVENEATVAYYLKFDYQFRLTRGGYLGAEFQKTMDHCLSQMQPNEASSSSVSEHHLMQYMDYQGIGLRSDFVVEKKLSLGLQFQAHPREILLEVIRAFHILKMSWKKIGHYNLKCRWCLESSGSSGGIVSSPVPCNYYTGDESMLLDSSGVNMALHNEVKFEVQLYQTLEGNYLLDLKRTDGPQLLFLNVCAAFLAQLRL
ncbi:hypothetical protein AQUCO_01400257v1 [Aquilegia coerulea]|uniref:non-specific serine/threonine protein kinase n=1 Tax=Aquilegia coerulea TaxID=218851 RepID=A0A2G5DVF0_AQUCA|nr:hypothetical protein AQUCO_01400257v1 [Aquilegia coerulea]